MAVCVHASKKQHCSLRAQLQVVQHPSCLDMCLISFGVVGRKNYTAMQLSIYRELERLQAEGAGVACGIHPSKEQR